jgi:hypothetical protein
LLSDTLEKVKDAINRVLPVSKKRTALEVAMWEKDSEAHVLDAENCSSGLSTGSWLIDGVVDRSIAMENLWVYRPRLVLHGPAGVGHGYSGAAALHHSEGYHV